MKGFWLFFMAASLVCAADFTTGQAARLVIGQETFTSQDTNSNASILGAAGGIAYAADTLFVADANQFGAAPSNHRVLLFKNLSTMLPAPTDEIVNNGQPCPACVGTASLVLGQPDFTTTTENVTATTNSLRLPTAVASDGVHVVVADTNHNRVLIWNSIPTVNDQPADVVVGQPDFASSSVAPSVTAKTLRGPEGVWIQNGKLYIADTDDNRILIYNSIPTANGAAADVVLGAPNFTTYVEPTLTQQTTSANASILLDPVSVTSDGTRLFVTDLGYNRVLIWNSIPTTNGAPADVAIGQPDLVSVAANNAFTGMAATSSTDTTDKEAPVLCPVSNGVDPAGNPTYPIYCNSTLDFPRFALSNGQKLFIADGGNDRVLVFNEIPTQNGQAADNVIGEVPGEVNGQVNGTTIEASDSADSLRTPSSLAWDGTNLYVADTYNRRVTVYSMGANTIPYQGVRNAASFNIFALGNVVLGGTITAGDTVTITICSPVVLPATTTGCISPNASNASTSGQTEGTDYTYTIQTNDTFDIIVTALVTAINSGSGDPNVYAAPDFATQTVLLAARVPGPPGNNVDYAASTSTNATITATTAGSALTGGGDASQVGAGTVVSIIGTSLSANTASADLTQNQLPTSLGGTEVYFNGIQAPLFYVSPTQINAQIPWIVTGSTSIPGSVNAFVRSVQPDGSIMVTTPVAATIVTENPGIFSLTGSTTATPTPPGVVLHGSSAPTGGILIDGTIQPGDMVTITIDTRNYVYTVQAGDTLTSVRDAMVLLIDQDPVVYAIPGYAFAVNLIIKARIAGPDLNGLTYSTSVTAAPGSSGAELILTPETTGLCCANIENAPVTADNPAVPGEILYVYATGLGLPVMSETNQNTIVTGTKYPANAPITQPVNFVSSLAGGKTANVLQATLLPGTIGNFIVTLQLNSDMPTDPLTNVYIAQEDFISNIVTFPLVNPTQ